MKSIPPIRLAARGAVLTLVSALVVLSHAGAMAQCAPPDTSDAIASSQSVFVGRVLDTDESGRVARVEVLSIWKGRDLADRVEVRGANSADSALEATDRRFDVGASYLFIPENGREPFLATSCSATQRYSNPPNLIPVTYQDAAGATAGRAPLDVSAVSPADEEAETASSILPLLGMIGLIAIASVAISWSRSQRPERLPETIAQPEPKPKKPRRLKRRNFFKDTAGAERATKRTIRRHSRGLRKYRRKQNRQVAVARKANGSTDTS